jgi:hypothetical protein
MAAPRIACSEIAVAHAPAELLEKPDCGLEDPPALATSR